MCDPQLKDDQEFAKDETFGLNSWVSICREWMRE